LTDDAIATMLELDADRPAPQSALFIRTLGATPTACSRPPRACRERVD
jgi:hypothetical protein